MKRLMNRKLTSRTHENIINPLESAANMADIMMVLVVGLILALIVNWNLDIETLPYKQNEQIDQEKTMSFEGENLEEVSGEEEQIDESGMERLGTVYLDEATGKYYIVMN